MIPGGFASVMLFTKLIDFLHFVRHVLDTLEKTNQPGRFLWFFLLQASQGGIFCFLVEMMSIEVFFLNDHPT